jgi:hypothetical protein
MFFVEHFAPKKHLSVLGVHTFVSQTANDNLPGATSTATRREKLNK